MSTSFKSKYVRNKVSSTLEFIKTENATVSFPSLTVSL